MNIAGLFKKKKNKKRAPEYIPDQGEYADQNATPEELRPLYRYAKTVFFLLFPAGCALSFLPPYFFAAAVLLSLAVSRRYTRKFRRLLDTRLRFIVFSAVPPVCLAAGFASCLAFFLQLAKIIRG